jgi:hypothetical protein
MFSRTTGLVICTLLFTVTACGNRTSSRTVREVKTSQTFYPRNEGCTFDGVPGAAVDISQMHNAKVISDECFAAPVASTTVSHSAKMLYITNPGCTIDGVPAATASDEQLVRSEAFSKECFDAPSVQ